MKAVAASALICAVSALSPASLANADRSDKQVLRETGSSFGDCVAEKHYPDAVAYILESPDNRTAAKKYRKLIDSKCMSEAIEGTSISGVRFSGNTFAFAIAESLVRRDFASSGPQTFSDRAPLVHRALEPEDEAALAKLSEKKRAEADKDRMRDRAWLLISKFGECAVRLAPEPTRMLAQTRVGTPDEWTLLKEMAPNFSACLPNGVELKFQPLQLRGTLMANYFRLASAPQVQREQVLEASE